MKTESVPLGIVGLNPRKSIGVHLSTGIKGPSGAPEFKGRFHFMNETTHSKDFRSSRGNSYAGLARDPHPSFRAWNDIAMTLGRELPKSGPGRVGVVRGNLIHARFQDAAIWNRSAQKLPEGHPNPPSRRPACEGNGIYANRYVSIGKDGVERYDRIACPNRECVFAMSGACKPSAHLLFMLRWDACDPFESQFPSLIAEWNTRGWRSLENLMGFFELVLGTEPLLTDVERAEADDETRATWKSGLAAELGVREPSLVGMPIVLSVEEKTKAADVGAANGKRFTVVRFSPDSDLAGWLLHQARSRRELSGQVTVGALPPPPSVLDADFIDVIRHESRVEIEPAVEDVVRVAEPSPAPLRSVGDLWLEVKRRTINDPVQAEGVLRDVLPSGRESTSDQVEQGFAALKIHPAFGDSPGARAGRG